MKKTPANLQQIALFPPANTTQRWRERFLLFEPVSEGGFNKREYTVKETWSDTDARSFVCTHHYSGSYGVAIRRYQLIHNEQEVGYCILGNPTNELTLIHAFGTELIPYEQSTELIRFVLLPGVPANAESWFIGNVLKLAAKSGIRGIVSFSDPFPRYNPATGEKIFPGHIGTIYQATNAIYSGVSTPRTEYFFADHTLFDERARSKIRQQQKGHRYAENILLSHGARLLSPGEDPTRWMNTEFDRLGGYRVRHRGKYRYLFTTDKKVKVLLPSYPYPKAIRQ